ncbi:hypothetical protein LTR66_016725 [Elasticomyces elasticus]|nr:hypothetical protein LTR66_016725 [Elasticomyces elasticus]
MIVSRCRDWTEEEIETANILCLVYGKFIDVWRQKEAALQNSQLTKLLLANSAHEVRTPLNAIINYLEIALEGSLDQDTRDNLAKSHSASKSLVYVINDLLDLTKTEEHKNLIKEESFDLHHTLREASDPFKGDAKRKGIEYSVYIDEAIPQEVIGDHRRVRQIVSNLIANAIQHTVAGGVNVDAHNVIEDSASDRCEMEICVEDSGSGMSQEKVDALFRELEEVTYESDATAQILLDEVPYGKDNEANNALGLGLAVVARTIRNMNGQLRLKTESGKGSRSIGSIKSGRSGQSQLSHRSDADRLINAIQEPLQLTSSSAGGHSGRKMARSSSLGDSSNGSALQPTKSRSIGSIQELKSSIDGKVAGQETVRDSGTPIRPVRVPEVQEGMLEPRVAHKVKFQQDIGHVEQVQTPQAIDEGRKELTNEQSSKNFHVLVAEDDPINSKIMHKRLEKLGHTAQMTVNGEECASTHGEGSSQYDVVLMDLQMPIVDGFGATKMIRSYEKTQSTACLSVRAALNGRIPIFAVSASLIEKEREKYIQYGFDGWILKPVDFKRVNELMKGIVNHECRKSCLYKPGQWEQGGWFEPYKEGSRIYDADTHPDPSRKMIHRKTTAQREDELTAQREDEPSPDTEGSVTPTAGNIRGIADTS